MTIQIQPLTSQDIPWCMQLVAVAGWNQTPEDWRRLIDYQPDGCFKASWSGTDVGTVTTTSYRDQLAWIGMMLVDPEFRRKGIGSSLMQCAIETLQGRSTQAIKLDATPAGRPVYERLGFVHEFDFQRWEHQAISHQKTNTATPIGQLGADLSRIGELDLRSFGADRTNWLERLAATAEVVVEANAVGIRGFGMLRPGRIARYLGPIVAADFATCRIIVTRLLSRSDEPVFWDIPRITPEIEHLAESLGFAPTRTLSRMFLGENESPGMLEFQYGLADPSSG